MEMNRDCRRTHQRERERDRQKLEKKKESKARGHSERQKERKEQAKGLDQRSQLPSVVSQTVVAYRGFVSISEPRCDRNCPQLPQTLRTA